MYQSTKRYGHELGFSAAFRQWRANSHCNQIHGYALSFKFIFEAEVLDSNNWVIDFGGMSELKEILRNYFDHTLLVAKDDPYYSEFCLLKACGIANVITVESTGCEAFAKFAFGLAENWLYENGHAPRVQLVSAEVCEHGANSALYLGENNGQ